MNDELFINEIKIWGTPIFNNPGQRQILINYVKENSWEYLDEIVKQVYREMVSPQRDYLLNNYNNFKNENKNIMNDVSINQNVLTGNPEPFFDLFLSNNKHR